MRRVVATIDRWGPILVALLTLFGVVGLSWQYDTRLARQEALCSGLQQQINLLQGQLQSRQVIDSSLRQEIATWQAYVVVLRGSMIESRIKVPPPPDPTQVGKNR